MKRPRAALLRGLHSARRRMTKPTKSDIKRKFGRQDLGIWKAQSRLHSVP
jgi:hypothetical protein